MLLSYLRLPKADGSQAVDLQRDALLAAGVEPGHLYGDHAAERLGDRLGLMAVLEALRPGDTLARGLQPRLRPPRSAASCHITSG
jgi:hypothetical protein